MTLYTQGVRTNPYAVLEDFSTPLGDYLGAKVEQGWEDTVIDSLARYRELDEAMQGRELGHPAMFAKTGLEEYRPRRAPVDSPTLAPDVAGERIADAGLTGHLTVPGSGIPSRALDILIERKRRELVRMDAANRAPMRYAWVGVPAQIATGIIDPVNVAASFIPLVGPTKYAAMLARAAGPLGRAGVRAGVGAAEGFVGSALVEPFVAAAKAQEQADYDMADSLLNVTFGSVLGGGLHVTGGAVADVLARAGRAAPATVPRGTEAPRAAPAVEAAPARAAEVTPDATGAPPRDAATEAPGRAADEPIAASRLAEERDGAISAPGQRFTVFRVGSGSELRNRNAGNAQGLADFLARSQNPDSSVKAVRGGSVIQVYDVAARAGFGAYTPIQSERGQVAPPGIGRRENKGGVWYSFGADGFDARPVLSVPLADVEAELKARGFEDFDDAGSLQGAEAIRAVVERALNQAQARVAAATPQAREATMRAAVSQAFEGRSVEVDPVLTGDVEAAQAVAQRGQRPEAVRVADTAIAAEADRMEPLPDEPEALQAEVERQAQDELATLAEVAAATADPLDAPNFGLPAVPQTIGDVDPLLTDTSTINTPEREARRQRIVDGHLRGTEPVEGRRPIAFVMGGGGASGKGTILARLKASGDVRPHGAVEIDPDAIKAQLPEYKAIIAKGDGRAAMVVHEESSMLAKRVLRAAQEGRRDIILDRTLGDEAKGLAELKALKEAGYEVRLFGVTVDPAQAVQRAVQRAERTGRFVPIPALLKAHKGFASAFEKYAEAVDHAVLFDNDVPKDAPAVQVAEKSGESLAVIDRARYNRFAERARLNDAATTIRGIGLEPAGLEGNARTTPQAGRLAGSARAAGARGTEAAAPGRVPDQRLTAAESELAELTASLPPEIRAELVEFDELINDADAYGRGARAAALCLMRT